MVRTEPRHIVIAGNIGVGKSTLVALLAETCGWTPVYELEAAHPYLDDYYADPQRWGFHSQVWFLTRRLTQHQQIAGLTGTVVQDRLHAARGRGAGPAGLRDDRVLRAAPMRR
ncbi:MAG: deoxynucleoside kinase [Chloroflexales bacterium]|nr:deoxynucleoside kinase [Chloroflexales bacterium]